MKWFFTPPNRPGNFVVYMQRNGMRLVTRPHSGAAEMKPIDEILHDFGCELAAHGLIDRHDIIGLQLPEKAFVELLGRVKSKVVRGPGSGKTDGLKDLVLVACDSGASINVTKQW